MRKGILIVSLDTELAWVRKGQDDLPQFHPLLEHTPAVIHRLLELFEKYEVAATWAIVGQLFRRPDASGRHPDWEGPFALGHDLLEAILSSRIEHEIGSHSFGHPLFDTIAQESADADIRRALEAAANWGIQLRSFVFPRNRVAHTALLPRHGFRAYRGKDVTWFESWPALVQRVCRNLDLLLALKPHVGASPGIEQGQLVNLAGHMIFRIPCRGFKKHLPVSLLVRKALKGIDEAAARKALFHLWFHPFNFGYRMEEHLEGLETVLRAAVKKRNECSLEICTMQQAARAFLQDLGNNEILNAKSSP